jgi:hypothetical protein
VAVKRLTEELQATKAANEDLRAELAAAGSAAAAQPQVLQAFSTVDDWLASIKIDVVKEALDEAGYDELDMILEGDADEMNDICTAVSNGCTDQAETRKRFEQTIAVLCGCAGGRSRWH